METESKIMIPGKSGKETDSHIIIAGNSQVRRWTATLSFQATVR